MLTKMMAFVVMSGALWVAGDSLYREFGCCAKSRQCAQISATLDCCSTGGDCCSISRSSCCAQEQEPVWQAAYVYSEHTGQVHFCQVVGNEFHCLATGEVFSECCCTLLEN